MEVSSTFARRRAALTSRRGAAQWRYVHIDDRIPCDKKGRPIYAHGMDMNETWVMLMEKAYAKLHGCYENLKSGFIDYGLRDLTSGTCAKLKWTDKTVAVRGRAGVAPRPCVDKRGV